MNNRLVSVIIPIYNAELYLEDTINSVIEQTYKNIEIILVNHCSTDDSKKIIESFLIKDNRIKTIDLNMNMGGPAYPRNMGIDCSTGEYIAFLDSDDVWNNNKLEEQINFIQKNNLNFTSCDSNLIDSNNSFISFNLLKKLYLKHHSKRTIDDLIKSNFIITSTVLMKKEIIEKFSEEKKYISVEDFDLWLKLLSSPRVRYKYQNRKLINYRILNSSASDRKNILSQELKSNLVISEFIFRNEKYISSYIYRVLFHTMMKYFKAKFKGLK